MRNGPLPVRRGAKLADEVLFRQIVERALEGVLVVDARLRTRFVNRRLAAMLGWEEREMLGRPVEDFLFPEDIADHRRRMRARKAGLEEVFERRFRRRDGSALWAVVSASALGDAAGRFEGAFALITDITARKRTERILEARLRLSEQAPRLALEEILRLALDEAEAITGSAIGFFHFVDEASGTLSLQAWSSNTRRLCRAAGEGRHYPIAQAGIWAEGVSRRRPVVHNDYTACPGRQGLPAGHVPVARELVVPVVRDGRVVALLGVGNKTAPYDEGDAAAVASLGGLVWDIVLRHRAEEEERRSREELRRLYLGLERAREEERRRIAREIHDELGQGITALRFALARVERSLGPGGEGTREDLAAVREIAGRMMGSVRRIAAALRPAVLDSLGLADALAWLAGEFSRYSGIDTRVRVEPEGAEVPPELATDLFRIAQEALNNVARHSGAGRARIALRVKGGVADLAVEDDGRGFPETGDLPPGGLGLPGMRERLRPHGGTLAVERPPCGGSRLRVRVPLPVRGAVL
ncbi:MAG: GAF domain-containing protein [Desulfobacterales bacterium]